MHIDWPRIREIHFHPEKGSTFWVNRAKQLGIDVFHEVNTPEDFWKLKELSLSTVRDTLPQDFIPKSFQDSKIPLESGGSSGEPILTYFTEREFENAFVAPYLEIVERGLFPASGNWLYLGPTGPHAVGRAARICSVKTSGQEPFMIDFDPRWAKKLPANSMPAKRYLEHICEQALLLFRRVPIEILFVTPPVLDRLCELLEPEKRHKLTGIQLAGMSANEEQWQKWRTHFPNAKFLIGYGNSLVGVFYHIEPHGYLISSSRAIVSLVEISQRPDRLQRFAELGKAGQVVVHRLDSSVLYLNLVERDQAIQIQHEGQMFLSQVGPIATVKIKKGLY